MKGRIGVNLILNSDIFMGKISDTRRAMAIGLRTRMQGKMKKMRALYQAASGEAAKEAIILKALNKNRNMSRNDFLGIAPPKRVVREKVVTHAPSHKSDKAPKAEKKPVEKKAA